MKTAADKQAFLCATTERITFLDSIRSVAIIMVIGIHTLGYCAVIPQNQNEALSFIIRTIPVPMFFLIDGYLLARSVMLTRRYDYSRYIRNSLLRLLVPWVVFTSAYTILRYFFELSGFLHDHQIIGHSLKDIVISSYGSVYAPQMYFLFSLFLIRVCSPVFQKLMSIKSYPVLLLIFICYYAAYKSGISYLYPYLTIKGGQEPILHALWGMQFFFLGIICFKTPEVIGFDKLTIPFLILFVLVLSFKSELGAFSFGVLQYLYLITFFLLFSLHQRGFHLLNIIGKNTMGIYLIHAPVVLKGVSFILNKFIFNPLLSFTSILIGVFIVTSCIVAMINAIPYGSLLFGKPYLPRPLPIVTP